METIVRSPSRTVLIGPEHPFCVIGERINPTGRKAFQAQLQQDDLAQIETDVARAGRRRSGHARHQRRRSAGRRGRADEQGVPLVQTLTELPLCIDSSVIEALESGLAAYEGKALVNSVTGEDERLEAILPIVARHGAAVIGLANDDEIPMEPRRRLEVAKKIVSAAGDHGIPPEDVIIDPLAMPVGAEPRAVTLFLETLHLLHDELGVNTTCGASNTSFGLPGRHTLGAAFLAVAQSHGLTSAIMDARRDETVEAVRATDFLLGRDEWGATLDRAAIARSRRPGSHECAGTDPGGHRVSPGPRPAHLRAGQTARSRRRASRPARRSSMRRAGTASRSTRPAVATARARSARCASSPGTVPLSPVDPRAFEPDELRAGWRLACRAQAREDVEIAVPLLQTRPEGGSRRRRPARDPSAGRAEALSRARRSRRSRIRPPTSSGCSQQWTTSSSACPSTCCASSAGRFAAATGR